MSIYESRSVRARIREFLGAETASANSTAMFLATADEHTQGRPALCKISNLACALKEDREVFRSLWDEKSLLVDLDIEYVNFDYQAEPFLDFERTFDLQTQIATVIKRKLLEYGVAPLHLLSGRGHHFVWRIRRDSACFARLALLGKVNPSLRVRYSQKKYPAGESVGSLLGRAYVGLGQVIEYFGAEVKSLCAPNSRLPIELTALEVGPGERGREMISFDISQFGDPIYSRVIRVPFSPYLKIGQHRNQLGFSPGQAIPQLFEIPVGEIGEREAVKAMRSSATAMALAETTCAAIPDCSSATDALVSAYSGSKLAEFHRKFYAEEPDPPEKWSSTYDRLDGRVLPPCLQFVLENPNDFLLRPSSMRRVTIGLLALGWHPRHIAGLIHSRFSRDFGWGDYWRPYDAATRAEFFVRLFAGLILADYDDLVDFNCRSTKEERICFQPSCQDNLQRFKDSLLARRSSCRIGKCPHNRVFLPKQDFGLPGSKSAN